MKTWRMMLFANMNFLPIKLSTFRTGVILIALIAFGCGPGAHDHDPSKAEETATGSEQATGGTQAGQVPVVTLNNGSRWKANPETTEGIQHMRSILESYRTDGSATTDLKDTLEAEFALIFERCTMTGDAHEQLHNYLLPLHTQLRELTSDAPRKDREAVLAYLQQYGNYFE